MQPQTNNQQNAQQQSPRQQSAPYAEPIRESTASIVLKIVLLQLVTALATVALSVALFWILNTGDDTALLISVLSLCNIILQSVDAVALVLIVLHWKNTWYYVTPKEIVVHRGTIMEQHKMYPTGNMESVEVDQSPLGKLLNYGTVKMFNPNLQTDVSLTNVHDPHKYARTIEEAKVNS